jgi:hypothetical protein
LIGANEFSQSIHTRADNGEIKIERLYPDTKKGKVEFLNDVTMAGFLDVIARAEKEIHDGSFKASVSKADFEVEIEEEEA